MHTIDMLVSRAVGFGVAFASAFSLVPLVVMCCPFLLVYGCAALLCRVFVLLVQRVSVVSYPFLCVYRCVAVGFACGSPVGSICYVLFTY